MNPGGGTGQAELAIDVRDEVRQRLVDARQILAGEPALDVLVGAHAEEYRVVLAGKILEGDIAADVDVQAKLDAHPLHDLAALLHDVLFELERRDAEGEQAADFRVAVEHHRLYAVARQNVGAAQARGSRADDRHALAGGHDVREVRLPALLERLVGNVLLDGADAHGAQSVVQRTSPLAEPVLRANASAHFRQRVRLMRELRGLEQLARVDEREPVRNVVVNRALPLAKRIPARQAPPGLLRGGLGAELGVDLAKMQSAHFHGELVRIAARNFQELQMLVGHGSAFEIALKRRAADW